jgi:Zn-dependent protease with chaperone function/type II secretory pathway pseudopilin PulG
MRAWFNIDSERIFMNTWVHPRERQLGRITLILGLLVWLALIVGTFGGALVGLAMGFVVYLFVQSALISHIKGNGVELTAEQFPDLHGQFLDCCDRLQMKQRPQAYVLSGHGSLNAFATRFLGAQYVVLLSDTVNAMAQHPDGVKFYLGHELGHLRMKHMNGQLLRWPVLWLPLLGGAYARARESTCDLHGAACCTSSELAAKAMSALAVGPHQWHTLSLPSYALQVEQSRGFWMSFHELIAGYPWLSKRIVRIWKGSSAAPGRHPLAYALAMFFPYAGRLGAGFGFLILVYVIGILAAIAVPAYKDYTVKAKMVQVLEAAKPIETALSQHYEKTQQVPESLAAIGLPQQLPDGSHLALDATTMIVTASTAHGELLLVPSIDDQGHVSWQCDAGEGMRAKQLPASCVGTEVKKD